MPTLNDIQGVCRAEEFAEPFRVLERVEELARSSKNSDLKRRAVRVGEHFRDIRALAQSGGPTEPTQLTALAGELARLLEELECVAEAAAMETPRQAPAQSDAGPEGTRSSGGRPQPGVMHGPYLFGPVIRY